MPLSLPGIVPVENLNLGGSENIGIATGGGRCEEHVIAPLNVEGSARSRLSAASRDERRPPGSQSPRDLLEPRRRPRS